MKRLAMLALCMLMAAATAASFAQVPSMKTVMREKLTHTQALVAAVVTADYAAIDEAAERLSRVTEAEIARWQTPGDPEYTRQGVIFVSSVEGLRDASMDRNAEAAGDHFMRLVSSCVHCHAHVRRARLVSAPVARPE